MYQMFRSRPMIVAFVLLCVTFSGFAQTPRSHVTSHSATSWETDNSSVTLQGTVTTQLDLANVLWVNQFGQRGLGTSSRTGQIANWTATGIPLRIGVNQITIILTDPANRSASIHYMLSRKPVASAPPPPPLKIGTGYYQNRPIAYQLWRGLAITEGDIILNLAPTALAQNSVSPAAAKGAQPDGIAISYTSQLWPIADGIHVVPYIVTGSAVNLTTALHTFNQTFSGLIQFVPRTTQSNYVNISLEGAATEGVSSVGMVGNEQMLDCGSECTVATWLHEMGHTVGLLHEHQRPDRGSYINLMLQNADLPNVPGNFTLISYDYQTIGLYDYASVMHYGAFDFSKAGLPVIDSIPGGIPLSNDTGYSLGDGDQIKRLYGAAPAAVTITTNPQGLQIVVDGAAYTAPQSFTWALNSTHTLSPAADPQTTNPVDGSTYAFAVWNDLGARSHTITVQPGSGTLTSPSNAPAVTVYEANFVRLQPLAYRAQTPGPVYPKSAGTLAVSPKPIAEYGGNFFADRTLVTLTVTPKTGTTYTFYDWFNLPYPPSDNPHSFYIQAPTTQAQAVFVPTPVTIIGESITGPNTWNPGLTAAVDGNWTPLPTGFSSTYDGTEWAPISGGGTTHTVSAGTMNGIDYQTQSPVTLNVYYNWDSWSDVGAMSHTISPSPSGSETISASFTPFYASYTVPLPLGSEGPGASCLGGVATSPAGTSYATNPSFNFYQDGTSVTSTATANAPFMFSGWSGSLAGDSNGTVVTIHDQFVPTATFNLVSQPLAITNLNPPSMAATAGGLTLTINGTGFSPGNTFVNWNGSGRASSFAGTPGATSTQGTVQLLAGDLAHPGDQDIFIGSSSGECDVGADASFTVTMPGVASGATAAYDGTDTTTEGTWTESYGGDGFIIPNNASSAPPAYAAVSVSGDSLTTWSASTTVPRALQTASGSVGRMASAYLAAKAFTFNLNLTDGITHRIALYLLDWNGSTRGETISILDASTKAVLDTETFSSFHSGDYAVWNIHGHVLIEVTSTGKPNAVVSGLFFGPAATATASYFGTDATTKGTWTGKYGGDGYIIANNATSNAPPYASVSVTGDSVITWSTTTADPRALQTASGSSSRIASSYSSNNFTFNVNLTDGNTHRIALYLLDWNATTRSETISIVDASTKAVLDTQTFSSFHNGEYATWNIHGHVLIQVQSTGTPNGVVSGLFFDAPPRAQYNGSDVTTKGTWTGRYGADGYMIANDASNLPPYASVSVTGDSLVTWSTTSTPRALQTYSGAPFRIASAYYSSSGFTFNVDLMDGNTHQIALYLLDWNATTRSETISILDSSTNAVLDTETFSSFHNGEYAVWHVRGHVLIQVESTGTPNSVVSGLFFN